MNNPFHYIPDAECDEAFRKLLVRLETLKRSARLDDVNFCRQLEGGCMLGVLIAIDSAGERHTLYAFSGQLGEAGFHYPGFVEPVFDYLQPDGYFKTKEKEISGLNRKIAIFEQVELTKTREEYDAAKKRLDEEVEAYREKCRLSKLERAAKRASGGVDEEENAAMIRQSQFEKAEFHRLKKRVTLALDPLAENLRRAQAHLDTLKEKRRSDSEALQKWLFTNFSLLNANGERKNLSEIFAETPLRVPPSGAGECCAPKLLQGAYLRNLTPVAIAEYWYGKPKSGTIRIHGNHYPACRGRCLPILRWMLQGLSIEPPLDEVACLVDNFSPEIIYENEWFCVVDKPSGMLSVPGNGGNLSLQQWLAEKYGHDRNVKVAHRLDQDTSGLIIATFGEDPFRVMQSLFATRRVKKTYIADLEGDYESEGIPVKGRIDLPLSPDWLDRPRQRIDFDEGKEAVTDYGFIEVSGGHSRIIFHPLTGRTHQLRVHAASLEGLGLPIAGDRLYGNQRVKETERLCLHAHKIEFTFPIDGHHYCFESPIPF